MVSSSIYIDVYVRIFMAKKRWILMKELWKMENIHVKLIIMVVLIVAGNVSSDLVGHWTLDEDSGNTAIDSSGNGFNIRLRNATWENGVFGGAVRFYGVIGGGVGDFKYSGNAITVCAWVWHDAFRIDKIERYVTVAPEVAVIREEANGALHFYIKINGNLQHLQVGDALTEGRWHHVAGTWDGLTQRLYIDGVEIASQALSGVLGDTSNVMISSDGDESFKGMLDDVRIYNHALDKDKIKQLYSYGGESFATPELFKLTDELWEARSIAEKEKPQKVIVVLEKKIAEYELWKDENTNKIDLHHELLSSELYFLLAKAKEAANAPIKDVAAAYKQSISQHIFRRNYVPALLWLFKNISNREYTDAIKKSVRNFSSSTDDLRRVAKDFEASENWAAFKFFCDAIFSEANDNTSYAKAIAVGLRKDGLWASIFSEYAQNKPELAKYNTQTSEERARVYIAQNKLSKAVKIYRDLASRCASDQDRSAYELKVCECIFRGGEYNRVLSELDDFTNNSKSVDRGLIVKAMLLKGQVYLQLSEIDRAYDIFSKLMRENPKTERALEASFFIGYCNMLQSKYEEAVEALNKVVRDCPQDSYANKARLCLARIKRVTE